jgi:SAM-dependent methyltransferase
MWDERFNTSDYVFGTDPADFVRREAGRLKGPSKVLCVADGEGRNSTFLATLGHTVTAMDGSAVAIKKARQLATERGVNVDFQVADIATWDWAEASFDAVFAVFIQFARPALRDAIFAGMIRTLRPGGILFLHGYTPLQLAYGTGGPKVQDQLYTAEMLDTAFAASEVLRLAEYDADLKEGTGHVGKSALIDLIARKPA